MTKWYALTASRDAKNFVSTMDSVQEFQTPCQRSEFQFIDKKPITLEVDKSSGSMFQDFIYDRGVPIISDRFKECLEDLEVNYLLYKKILLKHTRLGVTKTYWLALPPGINCLNRDESGIYESTECASKIVINEDRVGRFEMFKLAGVANLEIIISKRIADALKRKRYIGVHIWDVDEV